jgi:hypothetical protein
MPRVGTRRVRQNVNNLAVILTGEIRLTVMHV